MRRDIDIADVTREAAVSFSRSGILGRIFAIFHPVRPLGPLVRAALCRTILLAVVVMLPACSVIKITYNQAPELLYWYFDAYVDFTGAQSPLVKAELNRLHAWHRQTQLPGYTLLLQDAQRKVRGDLSPSQACVIFADVRGKLLVVYGRAEPSVALLASSLDASQLLHMERRFAKSNAEYRDDFLDPPAEAVRRQRLKKAVSRAEMLYGRLDDRQVEMVGRMIDESGFNAARSYAERLRRQRDLLETFRQLLARPAAEKTDGTVKAVQGLMERSVTSPDASYRDYLEKLTADNCKSFSDLHNATSTAQRNKAAAILNGYEKDLAVLAGQSGG